MSPHATDTCGPDLLRACAARARELDVPITTHLAQSQAEVATIGARYGGRSPAEYLDWLGLLAPDLLAAHCIASSGRRSEADGGEGRDGFELPARVRALRRHRGVQPVCRTRRQDGGRNRRLQHGPARRTQRRVDDLEDRVRSRGCGERAGADQSVTAAAAAVIKRSDLGIIAPGATADLTVIDLTHPHLQPLFDPRRGLIALANRANIDQVIVDGRVLIDDGRYVHGDEAAIIFGRNGCDRQDLGSAGSPGGLQWLTAREPKCTPRSAKCFTSP